MRDPTGVSLLGAFLLATAFVVAACYLCPPIWESNDDVGMAMAAHGYGMAAVGTPNIIYSNVLWGYLVRLIPALGGIDGYSIATLGALVIVGTVVIRVLWQFGLGMVACAAVFLLVLLRSVLAPQFTVNAGLLTVAAVLCWQMYGRTGRRGSLVAGCLLAFAGYLVRDKEFLLVLLVAAPLLPWRALVAGRTGLLALAVFAGVVVMGAALNHSAYENPEWRYFNELKTAETPFVDFSAGDHLIQRPDILKRHGYSVNDIQLVDNWFFADPKIADPQALDQMLHEAGPLPAAANARANVLEGVSALWAGPLLPLALAALLLALIFPSRRLSVSWGIFFAAVIAMGLEGRPGVLHVYIPPVCLLLITPLLLGDGPVLRRRHLAAGLLVIAAAVNGSHVISDAKTRHATSDYIQEKLKGFPTHPVVIWGDDLPFELIYPVLGAAPATRAYEFYALGAFTWAPFSRAYAEQAAGRGLLARLVSTQGVPMVANPTSMDNLAIYCREHLRGQLQQLPHPHYDDLVPVDQVRCTKSP